MTDQDLLDLHDRITRLAKKLDGIIDVLPDLHERIKTLEQIVVLKNHQQKHDTPTETDNP